MFSTKQLEIGLVLFIFLFSFSAFAAAPIEDAPDAFGVILEEFPDNRHFYARNVNTNKGTAIIKVKVYGISGYEQMRLKFYKNNNLVNTYEQTLNYNGNIANFNLNVPINAELTNHKMILVGVNNGVETVEASADEIVAGDVYAINGQSNAVAGAVINSSDLSTFLRSYTNANGWVYINQSFPGLWGGRLAKRIMDEQQIPVAIFNEAVGAQQLTYFLRNDNSPTSGNYGVQKARLTNAGVASKVRAMIWFQGEADGWSVSTEEYKSDFQDLYNDWNSDYNFEEVYIFQTRYKSCTSPLPYILEAHRQSADDIDGLHIMSTSNAFHDGCHFPYENGYQRLGDRLYGLVKRDFYGGSSSNVTPPDVSAVTVNNNQITITVSGTNSLSKIGTPWSDFELEGGTVYVISGSVSGNKIYLNLSGEAAGVTGVSYLAHPGNANDWIVNPNDIGLLSFYDFAISNPIPGGSGGGGGGGGGTVDCDNINITTNASGLSISGLDLAPITQVQVFNSNWQTTFECANNCDDTENINLPAGEYYVYVKYFNANWGLVCQANETVNIGGSPVTDNDDDGVPADQDCDDNDASVPTTPGTSCDDNNNTTTDDVIQSDGCTCSGTTGSGGGGGGTGGAIDCANIDISSSGTSLTISGLGAAPVSKVQVFSESWSLVFSCYGDCEDSEIIQLGEGLYRIKVALNNSSWQEVCELSEEVNLETGGSTGGGGGGGGGGTGGGGGGTSNDVDLELAMTAAETEFIIYDYINYTLTLNNNGTATAGNVKVEDKLPSGTVYSSHVSSNSGDYNPWNGIWTVGDLGAGETAVIQLKLFVLSDDQDIKNFAQVASATGTDPDSSPGNNNSTTPSEDDEAVVSLVAGEREANTVGIQLEQNRFLVLTNLFPNPANDRLNLQVMANEDSREKVQIYDSFGSLKKVMTLDLVEGLNGLAWDVAELPTGMYYILFETANGHEPIRFVKQRL